MTWETEVLADSPTIWSRFQGFTATPGTTHGTPTWQENGLLGAAEAVRLPFGQHAIQYVAPTEVVSGSSPWSIELIARNTYATGIYERVLAFQPQNRTTWGYISVKNGTVAANFGGVTCFGPDGNGDADQWRHIVLVADGATLSLYVNGALLDSQVLTSWAFPAGSGSGPSYDSIYLAGAHDAGTSGDLPNDTAFYTDQYIDEFAYYPSALSAGRVAAHYAEAAGPSGQPSSVLTAFDVDTRDRADVRAYLKIRTGEPSSIAVPINIDTQSVSILAAIDVQTSSGSSLAVPIKVDTETDYSVARRAGVNWGLRLTIGGLDQTHLLVASADQEWDKESAIVSSLTLMPPTGELAPEDYDGKSVVLEYIDKDASGAENFALIRYQGKISSASWMPAQAVLQCDCTSNSQARFVGMAQEVVGKEIGGYWSQYVFNDSAKGWAHARDRLETIQGDLWHLPNQGVRITPWATDAPVFELTDADIILDRVKHDPARRSDMANRITVRLDYRYERLRQRMIRCHWSMGISWCEFLINGCQLCQRAMIASAAKGQGGWQVIGEPSYEDIQPAGYYRCFPTAPGENNKYIGWGRTVGGLLLEDPDNESLAWAAWWTIARRWAQEITEQYEVEVACEASIAANGQIDRADDYGIESEKDNTEWLAERGYSVAGDAFTVAPGSGAATDGQGIVLGDQVKDEDDDAAGSREDMETAQEAAIAAAVAEIIRSHRHRVTIATAFDPRVKPGRVVRINSSKIVATGRVTSIRERFDTATGRAITEFDISPFQQGGSGLVTPSDIEVVEQPEQPTEGDIPDRLYFPTRIGGLTNSPPYNDEWTGYTTNYVYDPTDQNPFAADPDEPEAKVYPEQFTVEYPEITEGHLQAIELQASKRIDVVIPNDELTKYQ